MILPTLNVQRDWNGPEFEPKDSAVLAIFVPANDEGQNAQLVLTRRSNKLVSHRGQISLPGGRKESQEITPYETALREAEEEISLKSHLVQKIGHLSPIEDNSGRKIFPVVAWTEQPALDLKPNEEVESILLVPWSYFVPQNMQRFRFRYFGRDRESFLFNYENHAIWGLTAKILRNLFFSQS